MTIDQALDTLRKLCEKMDIDDSGHERECGRCGACVALYTLEQAIYDSRECGQWEGHNQESTTLEQWRKEHRE